MTAIIESSTWEDEIRQWETTDLALGGLGGVMNTPLIQLANRTKYLYDRISNLTEMPLAALPYPTIDTADHCLTVTPAAATAGGTVSVGAGIRLTLAEVVESAETGRLRAFETAAYTSADLVASSTYYLRAQVDGSGDLLLYTQRGADSDTIPASMVGTPDASSGGGFDTTVFDALLAKIVTGASGSVPTVTALANAHRLAFKGVASTTNVRVNIGTDYVADWTFSLGWARTPTSWLSVIDEGRSTTNPTDQDFYLGNADAVVSRYAISGVCGLESVDLTYPPTIAVMAVG